VQDVLVVRRKNRLPVRRYAGGSDGSSVEWIIWKSLTSIVVAAHFQPGLAHDPAVAFAMQFR
jgi:hypothetical protein